MYDEEEASIWSEYLVISCVVAFSGLLIIGICFGDSIKQLFSSEVKHSALLEERSVNHKTSRKSELYLGKDELGRFQP